MSAGVMRLIRRDGSGPMPASLESLVRFAINLTRKGWSIVFESDTHVVLSEDGTNRLVVLYK